MTGIDPKAPAAAGKTAEQKEAEQKEAAENAEQVKARALRARREVPLAVPRLVQSPVTPERAPEPARLPAPCAVA
jgi:hypothetical protein